MTKDKNHKYGILGTIIFHGIVLIILFIFSFKPSPPPYPDPEGILISFGDNTEGLGRYEPANQKTTEYEQQEEEQILTQDFQDVPAIENKKKKIEENTEQKNKTIEDKNEEKTKINKKALFPSNYNPTNNSQGLKYGDGNKGSPNSNINGTGDSDLGKGKQGVTYSLAGREAVRLALPKYPSKNIEGKVVLSIRVDNSGNVIAATVSKGTTTFDPDLIKEAKLAAYKTKFDKVSDPLEQIGTITFVFKLK